MWSDVFDILYWVTVIGFGVVAYCLALAIIYVVVLTWRDERRLRKK